MILGFLFLLMPLTTWASHGLFMVVKGDVKVIQQNQTITAKVGTKVMPGDTVTTGAESRAKIVMVDRNVINVSPDTKLKIEEYTSDATSKNVKLSLLNGKIRNNVEQKYDNLKNKFEVKTPTAVAGVRGTQFITSYNDSTKATEIITLRGQVEFKTLNPNVSAGTAGGTDATGGANSGTESSENAETVKSVVVSEGETSSVSDQNKPPEPPKKVPQEQLNEIEKETNVRSRTTPAQQSAQPPQTPPPPPPNTNTTKPPIIEGAIQNNFDKTKIKVEPKPPGSGN